jgi:hypothetical protein
VQRCTTLSLPCFSRTCASARVPPQSHKYPLFTWLSARFLRAITDSSATASQLWRLRAESTARPPRSLVLRRAWPFRDTILIAEAAALMQALWRWLWHTCNRGRMSLTSTHLRRTTSLNAHLGVKVQLRMVQ